MIALIDCSAIRQFVCFIYFLSLKQQKSNPLHEITNEKCLSFGFFSTLSTKDRKLFNNSKVDACCTHLSNLEQCWMWERILKKKMGAQMRGLSWYWNWAQWLWFKKNVTEPWTKLFSTLQKMLQFIVLESSLSKPYKWRRSNKIKTLYRQVSQSIPWGESTAFRARMRNNPFLSF